MGTCNCLSEKERHDVTIESGRRITEKGTGFTPSHSPKHEIVIVFDTDATPLQGAIRGYLARKRQKVLWADNLLTFEGTLETEDCTASYIGSPDSLLSSEVRKVMKDLPRFDYSLQTQGVTQRAAVRLSDGSVYEGEWYETARFGKGRLFSVDGSFLEGYWKNGYLHYKGRVIYPIGDCYEGGFKHGLREGEGKLSSAQAKSSYEGSWHSDKQHGFGIERFSENNSTYTGQFFQGTKHGKGLFQWSDGSSYRGDFQENRLEGEGHYLWADKRQYNGTWVDSQMHGKGCFQWPDGRVYDGEYRCDKKEGFGVYRWENGKVYEGSWLDGKMHGQGYLTIPGKPRKLYEFTNGKKGSAVDESN